MAILNKDPDKAAAKAEQREQKVAEQRSQREEAQRRQAEAAFWSSPQGQARSARVHGNRFFQLSLPLSSTQRSFSAVISGDKSMATRSLDPTDLLGAVESEGWRLEDAGYVFREVGSVSRDKLLSSGQTASVMGEIVGIYLFRAAETSELEVDSLLPPRPA
jgi:hypothetical protein